MNSVAEIKGFTWPGIHFEWKRDGVNHHSEEGQEEISQKVMEGWTYNQFSDGLDMFDRDDLVSDLIFEKLFDCFCQWLSVFSSVISFCSVYTLMYLIQKVQKWESTLTHTDATSLL